MASVFSVQTTGFSNQCTVCDEDSLIEVAGSSYSNQEQGNRCSTNPKVHQHQLELLPPLTVRCSCHNYYQQRGLLKVLTWLARPKSSCALTSVELGPRREQSTSTIQIADSNRRISTKTKGASSRINKAGSTPQPACSRQFGPQDNARILQEISNKNTDARISFS